MPLFSAPRSAVREPRATLLRPASWSLRRLRGTWLPLSVGGGPAAVAFVLSWNPRGGLDILGRTGGYFLETGPGRQGLPLLIPGVQSTSPLTLCQPATSNRNPTFSHPVVAMSLRKSRLTHNKLLRMGLFLVGRKG